MSTTARYLCDARLFHVASATDGEKTMYRVILPTDPAIPASCTCPAFRYGAAGSECKHIRWTREDIADDGIPELLPKPAFDFVQVMSDAFRNGFDSGFELGRTAEKLGVGA